MMRTLEEKLNGLRNSLFNRNVKIMIMGLGSVGLYLLDYLLSLKDGGMEICVAGRSREKMVSDVNIVKIASLIRDQNRAEVKIISGVDFEDVDSMAECLRDEQPDIIVNSSRAYSGLKYGSISWSKVRAYGIWAPLAIKYTRTIMEAYERAGCGGIVINTSYSDAVIPWLKSAGKPYPDFGSGNINHLIPRIKLAVAKTYGLMDYWNIDITYATSHFHDVVISKEGQTEGVSQLIDIRHEGKKLEPDMDKIFEGCKIPMPVDGKRNMMNASSNVEIIQGILAAAREGRRVKLHCPGAFGQIGGYPVIIDGRGEGIKTYIDEAHFAMADMCRKNRESIYLDGIENVEKGKLYYTDELIEKCRKAFGITLMKQVEYDGIEEAAQFLIHQVIEKNI